MAGDTIYALSSAQGKAGVHLVRVSGPAALHSFKKLCAVEGDITPRSALFKTLYHPRTGAAIDEALVIPFLAPRSFTGEDVVEYQIHGSPAVLKLLFDALSTFDGHRMAEHGEYTRRAFENGKMDLTEAEAIADLIAAETEMQRQQALLQMNGALSGLYEDWRARLIKIMAYIEVVMDFPDEDIPDEQVKTTYPALLSISNEIRAHLNDNGRGERLRDGIHIAIVGAPNAGKSSLVNALTRRDVAIVSAMAGTTRDVIETHLDIGGYPVIIADTAGLRAEELSSNDGHDAVEAEGIRRATSRAQAADIKLLVFDGTLDTLDEKTLALCDENSIFVFTRKDDAAFISSRALSKDAHVVMISNTTQDGMTSLQDKILSLIETRYLLSKDTPSLTRARHREILESTLAHLEKSCQAPMPELMAEDIRMAARALGRITGRVDVEDLLDVIFRDFCIGK